MRCRHRCKHACGQPKPAKLPYAQRQNARMHTGKTLQQRSGCVFAGKSASTAFSAAAVQRSVRCAQPRLLLPLRKSAAQRHMQKTLP
ncbi:hypothetical protein NPIL_203051 [Nephila pilipes]|uniref:Uncharacterized protein n=1 Tax=Nephila pilipes TaxID=299642 RepID=A0A8X6QUC0_NEPPI|nr:hypothetical protein NPIL_203051 [Nephila pilipes]